ncbi:MAG: EamA family transporter [Terriglobia bacterium]
MKTAVFILIIVISSSLGDLLVARGMRRLEGFAGSTIHKVIFYAKQVLTNGTLLRGVCFMAVSFFAFMAVLSWAELSLVVPATSFSYVITTAGAKVYLKEHISPLRWAGTVFVCLGVALISLP